MSQFLDTVDTGGVSLETFSRSHVFSPPLLNNIWDERGAERAKIQKSIAYMFEHLTERTQVSKLAALINVSPSYFFALFKRQTGYAPIDFLIHLRMHRACRLLDTTRLSIKEIADVLGYDDAFYFSRLFKSVTSIAPTGYRVLPAEVREDITANVLPEAMLNGHGEKHNLRVSPVPGEQQRARA